MKIGDKVWYRGSWGEDAPVATTITGIGRKNGRTVYDCEIGRWGYEHQFTLMIDDDLSEQFAAFTASLPRH